MKSFRDYLPKELLDLDRPVIIGLCTKYASITHSYYIVLKDEKISFVEKTEVTREFLDTVINKENILSDYIFNISLGTMTITDLMQIENVYGFIKNGCTLEALIRKFDKVFSYATSGIVSKSQDEPRNYLSRINLIKYLSEHYDIPVEIYKNFTGKPIKEFLEERFNPKDQLTSEDKKRITLVYNSMERYVNSLDFSYEEYLLEQIANFYFRREYGIIQYQNGDFFNLNIEYYLPTYKYDKEFTKEYVKKHIKDFKKDAFNAAWEFLSKSKDKRLKGLKREFLGIHKIQFRSNFAELWIMVGLKKEILELKEKMETVEVI